MNAHTKSKPCSCGGSGGCGGNCGCGGRCSCGCGSECRGGPLQRPLFFAGQLLTEDDLQLLSDYAATKGRMHNRFLHGAGVVCGLQVGCHPCGGGKVIVHSGAALDCCGNDIYVPCSVELDIIKMIGDLRLKSRGGHDCGDPCEEDCGDAPDSVKCLDRKGRRYCLYVEYCEELEEPVTPYSSNGDCAVQVCKPTRVREGYTFVLRCPTGEPEPETVFSRILCCLGDLTDADKSANDVRAVDAWGKRYRQVSSMAKAGLVLAFTDADRREINGGVDTIPGPGGSPPTSAEPSLGRLGTRLNESAVRRLLDRYQATASAIIRYDLQSAEAKDKLANDMPGLATEVEEARSLIQSSAEALKSAAAEHLSSARDRMVADLWLSQGVQWTDPKMRSEFGTSEPRLLYAYNAPTSMAQMKQFAYDLVQLRDRLIDGLDSKALFSDCRLRRDVLAIQLPTAGEHHDSTLVVDAATKLSEALLRYLVECICAALNPPCQPCHDDAVKLACLTVEDCEVVRICNLERTYVLSGPAMRYWLPFLHTIGEFFEKACCEFPYRLGGEKEKPAREGPRAEITFERKQGYMKTTAPASRHIEERPQLAALMQIANIDQSRLRSAVNLAAGVGHLALSGRELPPRLEFDLSGSGRDVKTSFIDMVAKEPQVRETLLKPIEDEVASVRDKVESVRASSEGLAASVESQVATRLAQASRTFEKRLTDSEQASAQTVKELRTALQDQSKQATTGLRDVTRSLDKRIANEEASAKTVKELQAALRDQQKRNDVLETRLTRLEGGS